MGGIHMGYLKWTFGNKSQRCELALYEKATQIEEKYGLLKSWGSSWYPNLPLYPIVAIIFTPLWFMFWAPFTYIFEKKKDGFYNSRSKPYLAKLDSELFEQIYVLFFLLRMERKFGY